MVLEILELLNESQAMHSHEIQDFRQGPDFYYVRICVSLRNNTILSVRQYVAEEDYSYSYHWQDKDGVLIMRWDNAPHHKGIETYPNHKHIGDRVVPSTEITLKDVL